MQQDFDETLRKQVRKMGRSYREPIVLLTANELGIFAAIGESAQTVSEIAEKLRLAPRGTEMLLNALVGLGLLHKTEDRYSIREEVRAFLLPGTSVYMGDMLRHDFKLMQRWMQLADVVRSGRPVRKPTGAKEKADRKKFIMAMSNVGWQSATEMAKFIDLSPVRRLLDLGGGPAIFSICLCQHFPDLQTAVFDAPDTIEAAKENIAAYGMQHRIDTIAGDFMTDPLTGTYDAVLLSSVLHTYSPEQNSDLLRKVFGVLSPGGRVMIRGLMLEDDKTAPLEAALFSLNMLLNTEHGACYAFHEIATWLEQAGFRKISRTHFSGATYLVQGVKIE